VAQYKLGISMNT